MDVERSSIVSHQHFAGLQVSRMLVDIKMSSEVACEAIHATIGSEAGGRLHAFHSSTCSRGARK
jgi:hypothetical protein